MANVSLGNNGAAFKDWYNEGRVFDLIYPQSTLFAMVPKRTDFDGSAMAFAVKHGGPVGGRSATFANAVANESAGSESQFLVTRKRDYCVVSIETEALKASQSKKGAFFRLGKGKIDDAIKAMSHNIGFGLYNNGGGARGRVASGGASTTLTLTDPRDIHYFEVGMVLDSSATDGTTGSADGGGVAVTGINRTAGTLTAAGNWNAGVAGFSDNDYIFAVGDFGNAINGLGSWIPGTAPTGGDSFFGVNRSSDTERLAGIRYDGTSQTNEEALISAESELQGIYGGNPAVVMMHPKNLRNLKIELGARARYEMTRSMGKGTMSFKALTLDGGRMQIQVLPDLYCPVDVAYMLQLDTWVFASLGKAPDIQEALGHNFQWKATEDALQMRFGWYGNLACWAPGYNARISLAA